MTLPDGKHLHEQNPRVVVTIHISNAENTAMQIRHPHYDGILRCFCIIGRPNDNTNATRQHERCHSSLVFCKRLVAPRWSRLCWNQRDFLENLNYPYMIFITFTLHHFSRFLPNNQRRQKGQVISIGKWD